MNRTADTQALSAYKDIHTYLQHLVLSKKNLRKKVCYIIVRVDLDLSEDLLKTNKLNLKKSTTWFPWPTLRI